MKYSAEFDLDDLQMFIKRCFRESIDEIKSIPVLLPLPDKINLPEACEHTGLSKSQIYKLSMTNGIPKSHYGKRLIFSRKALTDWMESRTISKSLACDIMADRLSKANGKRRPM